MRHQRVALASKSPRRRELLAMIGWDHDIIDLDYEESAVEGESPVDTALRLSREKAAAGSKLANGIVTIGADTVVDVDGVCLGKPSDDDDALSMLRSLSGRAHFVHTGVALARCGELIDSGVESTRVTFCELSDRDISDFIASGEARDKSGAYSAQGGGAIFIEKIEGCFFNVVGLPLFRLDKMLLGLDKMLSAR